MSDLPPDLFAQVYDQLRALAQHRMNSERAGHTLAPTALVHEAYLKLLGPRKVPWQSKAHIYAAAAQAMRQILIDGTKPRDSHKHERWSGKGQLRRQTHLHV